MDGPARDATLLKQSRQVVEAPGRLRGRANRRIDPGIAADGSLEDVVAPAGWKTCLAVLGTYVVVVALATHPMIASIRTALPWNIDPVQHLKVMRWYKTCLLEGSSPFLHWEIQHPLGAPIGLFSPMLFQTSVYMVLSSAIPNDVVCYNLLWLFGFLLTGMGTFLLAHRMVGDAACAWFAGLAAMLSGPMMMHAHGHLELLYVGWFPLFMATWIRLLERPGQRSAAIGAVTYGLLTLSSGYFAVMAVIPAAWYLVLEGIAALRRGDRAWFRPRLAALGNFTVLVIPFALVAFSGQLWNVVHGLGMDRPRSEFERFGVPWYGYLVPTTDHWLGRAFGIDAYKALGRRVMECSSYLGLATLGLILYAMIRRVGPRKPLYWWSSTVILVVLSFGAFVQIGSMRITMPSSWLFQHVFAFRMLRALGRFNLFASVAAAILAASGLEHLVARWRRPAVRWAICGALAVVTVADLSMIPYRTQALEPVPAQYARLIQADPRATFLDAPLHSSSAAHPLPAISGYWQSFHRAPTTGGYSGYPNIAFDNQLVHNMPFSFTSMGEPSYLQDLDSANFGIISDVRVLDFVWLYLTANDLRYVMLHRSPTLAPEFPDSKARLETLLMPARISADETLAVFDRILLPTPGRPTLALGSGWRGASPGRKTLVAAKVAELSAYNPDPTRELTFTLKAKALGQPRTIRLRSKGVELAVWQAGLDIEQTLQSPPFRLPVGLQSLGIESDAEGDNRDRLRVSEVLLREADATNSKP